jgi:hypothetical protein
MATAMRYEAASGGDVIFEMESRGQVVGIRLSRREVMETVLNLCKTAGLPEPWKKG